MITRYSDHATVVETDEDILAFEVTGGALERAEQSEFAPLNNRRDWSS